MPRSCSSFIQSDVACRAARRAFTDPAVWMAPPYSRSFSVSVVLPASGWLMMAKVRRRAISAAAVRRTAVCIELGSVRVRKGNGPSTPEAVGRAARQDPLAARGPHLAFARRLGRTGSDRRRNRMNRGSKLMVAAAVVATPIVVLRVANPEPQPATRTAPTDSAAACALVAGPHPLPAVLMESSGIARARDGSLWTHNDGDEARLYRVDAAGAIAQVVQLEGAGAADIEDIDAGPCPDGVGECIWLADTGDNDGERAAVALLVLQVPDTA